jgi:hypothetical protein
MKTTFVSQDLLAYPNSFRDPLLWLAINRGGIDVTNGVLLLAAESCDRSELQGCFQGVFLGTLRPNPLSTVVHDA